MHLVWYVLYLNTGHEVESSAILAPERLSRRRRVTAGRPSLPQPGAREPTGFVDLDRFGCVARRRNARWRRPQPRSGWSPSHRSTCKFNTHIHAVRSFRVAAKRLAGSKAPCGGQRSRRSEGGGSARLQADPLIVTKTCRLENVIEHGSANSLTPRLGDGVHRLEFSMEFVQFLQRDQGKQLATTASAEHRDRGIKTTANVKSMVVFGWARISREAAVRFDQRSHVIEARIVNSNCQLQDSSFPQSVPSMPRSSGRPATKAFRSGWSGRRIERSEARARAPRTGVS